MIERPRPSGYVVGAVVDPAAIPPRMRAARLSRYSQLVELARSLPGRWVKFEDDPKRSKGAAYALKRLGVPVVVTRGAEVFGGFDVDRDSLP